MVFNPYWYLLFVAPCFVCSYIIYKQFLKYETKGKIESYFPEIILNNLIIGSIGALLAAKIEFLLDPNVKLQKTIYAYATFFFAGQRWDGAFLFVLAYNVLFVSRKLSKRIFTCYFNSVCLTSCILYAIGKVGCFLAGHSTECSGSYTTLPWGVNLPPYSQPIHPRQLYDATFHLVLFAGILILTKPGKSSRYFLYILVSPIYCAASDLLSFNPVVFYLFTSSQIIDFIAVLLSSLFLLSQVLNLPLNKLIFRDQK